MNNTLRVFSSLIQIICLSWMKLTKKALAIPSPGIIISVLIGVTLLVAVGSTLTKDNDTGTAGVQSTVTGYSTFVQGVIGQTVGPDSTVKLVDASVVGLIALAAVIALGAVIIGYKLI